MSWRTLRRRLESLLFRKRAEQDLDDELQFHLAMEARKHGQAGMDPSKAELRALVNFGGVAQVQEECRDQRGWQLIETITQDVRYALRGFRRAPGFALTVIATIALGLGINTAAFTAFNAYVLRPLAVRDPYSLYEFSWISHNGSLHRSSWQELQDFQKSCGVFSESLGSDFVLTTVDGHQMYGHLVTDNYFTMLGGDAALGRVLLPGDAPAPGTSPLAVLGYSAWKNKFGSDPDVVGKKLMVRGYPLAIIGVAREGFTGVSEIPPDFYVPLTMRPLLMSDRNISGRDDNIRVTGRLRPGWSVSQTRSALLAWARNYTAARPPDLRADRVDLVSRSTVIPLVPEVVAALAPILAAFGLVLLAACANIANLMLARAMARQREIGVRLAMGAARSRLIRQLLTESVLLALPAALAGYAIAKGMVAGCLRILFATVPRGYSDLISVIPMQADLRVFGFMLGAALAAALLFGLAPAIQATRPTIVQAARGEFTTDHRPTRLRHSLVVAQITVSALFLICAAILLRVNLRVASMEPRLDLAHVVEMDVQDSLRDKLVRQLVADPRVEMVASAGKAPLAGVLFGMKATPAGSKDPIRAMYQMASPEYFSVFHLPVVRGRAYTGEEAKAGAPVAMISEATAQRLFPGRDPLGQWFSVDFGPYRQPNTDLPRHFETRVVGVTRDAVNGYIGYGLDSTCIFFPSTILAPGKVLFARVRGDAEAARQQLSASLSRAVPGSVDQMHTMDEILAVQRYPYRLAYWIAAALGGLALALTLAGVYGVLSYLVEQRRKEIGIRMALGAGSGQVIGLVMRQSLRLALIGTAIGAAGALGFGRFLSYEIPGVVLFDARAFGLGSLLVFVAAIVAALVPSRRAVTVEPLTALRCD